MIDPETKNSLDAFSKSAKRSKSFPAAEAVAAYAEPDKWQLDELDAGLTDLESGRTVLHERVSKWMKSWGEAGETKAPR